MDSKTAGLMAALTLAWACGEGTGGMPGAPSPFSHEVLLHVSPETRTGVATGAYDRFSIEWGRVPVDPKYAHVLAFLPTPMMPPVLGGAVGPGPLVLYSDDFEVLVFSPMDRFHAALVSFEDGEIRYGLHGEIEEVPAGFSQRFILVRGRGIAATIEHWGDILLADRGRSRADRYADTGLSRLGYWTDNGAAYYYATEPGMTEEETLLAVKAEADALWVPFGYFQLDSWWYFKAGGTGLGPGGLVRWEPQPEMFPDGLAAFHDRLGLPLIAHNRWFAVENDYRDLATFVDGPGMSLPVGGAVYDRFMDDARAWGVVTYEQDWILPQFFGVPWLRQRPERADDWLAGIATSAASRGLTMQICMAGAADLMQAVDLPAVTTVRTSIDYKAGVSKESFWPQFHTVNMLAWAVGVWPFKDNFHSSERAGEAEALVSALSAGMVGAGDAIGALDAGLLARTCRADGLLLKPDRPALPVDAMFLPHQRPFTVHTLSARPEGTWHYVAAFHLAAEHPDRTAEDRLFAALQYDMRDPGEMFVFPKAVTDWHIDLARDLGVEGPVVAWNWRNGTGRVVEGVLDLPEAPNLYDHAYVVLAPIFRNGLSPIGETRAFVTMADRRFVEVDQDGPDAVRFLVAGSPGEKVAVVAHDARHGRTIPAVEVTVGADGLAEAIVRR